MQWTLPRPHPRSVRSRGYRSGAGSRSFPHRSALTGYSYPGSVPPPPSHHGLHPWPSPSSRSSSPYDKPHHYGTHPWLGTMNIFRANMVQAITVLTVLKMLTNGELLIRVLGYSAPCDFLQLFARPSDCPDVHTDYGHHV